MATRWYREALPRIDFFGERGSTRWAVLRSPWRDQALRLHVHISGATTGGTQDAAFTFLLVGADGVQQAPDIQSTNLGYAGTQEVGLVVNEFAAEWGVNPPNTGQLNLIQYAAARYVVFDPAGEYTLRYPVLAIRFDHLNDDGGGTVDIFDPDFVTGTVFYEVED